MKYILLTIGIILLNNNNVLSQQDSITYGLKGKIIRAFEASSEDGTFYSGLKGSSMGTGLVYKSTDYGKSWHPLNDGKPIDPYVADIQAIAEANLTNKTLFAGTWKNGLFKSDDGGLTWYKDQNFPSHDIRSIRMGHQNPNIIYASTSNFGVVKSLDGGNTWKRNDPALIDSTFQFAWSIEISPRNDDVIFAQTFTDGVWKSSNQGETWKKVLDTEGKVCWDMKVADWSDDIWVATSQGGDSTSTLYHSVDMGVTWNTIPDVPQIGINQVDAMLKDGQTSIVLGSWQDGVYEGSAGLWTKVNEVTHAQIAHILPNRNGFIIGSWGDGIFHIQ